MTPPRLPEFCAIVIFASLTGCVIGMVAEVYMTAYIGGLR